MRQNVQWIVLFSFPSSYGVSKKLKEKKHREEEPLFFF
jgi:hypothetical protein